MPINKRVCVNRRLPRCIMTSFASVLAMSEAMAEDTAEPQLLMEQVITVGTRMAGRVAIESLAPVDVITSRS